MAGALNRGHGRRRGHASRDLPGDPGVDPAFAPLTARADLRSSSETASPRRRARRCVALSGADSDPAPSSSADGRPGGPGTGLVSAKISIVWLIVGSPGDCYPISQHQGSNHSHRRALQFDLGDGQFLVLEGKTTNQASFLLG
jgi:hypothetical protein